MEREERKNVEEYVDFIRWLTGRMAKTQRGMAERGIVRDEYNQAIKILRTDAREVSKEIKTMT